MQGRNENHARKYFGGCPWCTLKLNLPKQIKISGSVPYFPFPFLMDGGEGKDILVGSGGTDTLVDGMGDDEMSGGRGNDWQWRQAA